MLKIITMLAFFLFGIVAEGQVSETRKVSGFMKIEIKNAELIFMESNPSSLRIEAVDENALTEVKTTISNGTLKILNNGNDYDAVKVYVSPKNVSSLAADKNAIVTAGLISTPDIAITLNSGSSFTGTIKAGRVNLVAKAGTTFKGKIDTGKLEGNFSSDAKIILSGTSRTASIQADTKAICNARNLKSDALSVTAGGNSKVWIYADKQLDISVAENARVFYNGLPQQVKLNENAIVFDKNQNNRNLSYNY